MKRPRRVRLNLDPAGRESRARRAELELVGPDLGVVGQAEGDQRGAVRERELLGQPPSPLVADVDGGRSRRRAGEELALRGEVVLHRLVEVEVVLAEVREHERVEANTVEAVEHRRVGRRFEGDAAVAGVEHLAERALEVDRLRRRADDWAHLATDAALDRAEKARPPAGGLQHGVQEVRGRRLPARSRDARNLELARRLPEERIRGGRHRSPGRGHDELRNLRLDRTLDDERDGTVLDRLCREVVPVGVLAGDGEERRAGSDGARVVGEVPHLNGVGAAEDRLWCERSDEALELHIRRNAT